MLLSRTLIIEQGLRPQPENELFRIVFFPKTILPLTALFPLHRDLCVPAHRAICPVFGPLSVANGVIERSERGVGRGIRFFRLLNTNTNTPIPHPWRFILHSTPTAAENELPRPIRFSYKYRNNPVLWPYSPSAMAKYHGTVVKNSSHSAKASPQKRGRSNSSGASGFSGTV